MNLFKKELTKEERKLMKDFIERLECLAEELERNSQIYVYNLIQHNIEHFEKKLEK